jgi:hypothetical protein
LTKEITMNKKLFSLGIGILSASMALAIIAPAVAGTDAAASTETTKPVARTAPGRPDPVALVAVQKQAIAPLAFMDGEWRGTASTTLPDGSKHELTQTERVGSFLDGSVKVIEGRGYEADGRISFNALGVIYFDHARKALRFQAHAMGNSGEYSFVQTAEGFVWEIPAGPMTIRYTATIKGGEWHEVGDRVMPGAADVRFFEMKLKRIGDSSWPAAGAVGKK